jgi:hypothetical protein
MIVRKFIEFLKLFFKDCFYDLQKVSYTGNLIKTLSTSY